MRTRFFAVFDSLPWLLKLILPLVLLTVQGCSYPTMPEFRGRMIFRLNSVVYELKSSGDTSKYHVDVLAENIRSGSVSPDNKFLLYSNDTSTQLLNLETKVKSTLYKFPVTGVSWAPNSSKFSFSRMQLFKDSDTKKEQAIWVYDLVSESTRLIYFGDSRTYYVTGNSFGNGVILTGAVEGGIWLDDAKILFQRITIDKFPFEISSSQMYSQNVIPPTTTSIAEIAPVISIKDCQTQRWVRGVTRDKAWTLYSTVEQLYTSFHDSEAVPGKLFLTSKFLSYDNPDSREIEYNKYEKVGLIERSSIIYYIKKVNFWGNQKILLVDPASFKVTKRFNIQFYDVLKCNIIMDRSLNFIAYYTGHHMMIYDIKTGDELMISKVLPELNGYGNEFVQLLAWID